MKHKFLVLLIKGVGLFACFAYCYFLVMAGILTYELYIKPEIAKCELKILIDHQRALLNLQQEYGELVHGDISR